MGEEEYGITTNLVLVTTRIQRGERIFKVCHSEVESRCLLGREHIISGPRWTLFRVKGKAINIHAETTRRDWADPG